jgi:hypothetical protein
MKKFTKINVSEQMLEELVRRHSDMIEEGLSFVDHQKRAADGRLDVFMVDSGKSLVVAELKIIQDDEMLFQGLDYYDYVSTHIEAFARLYKQYEIDPTQQVRLFLIAPNFSQTLVNRCKWLDLEISLFTFNCLKFEDDNSIVPIFTEQQITELPKTIEVTQCDDHLNYITDITARARASGLLEEIKSWKPDNISTDSIKYAISLKINNRVFAYFGARRQHFYMSTYNEKDEWTKYPIKTDDDLLEVKPIIKAAMEKRAK